MSLEITMRHIRALAGKRGYRVFVDGTHLHLIGKSDGQRRQTFDVDSPFRIDPPYTQQFTLLCLFLWLQGYDLTYEEPTTVKIDRAIHHPRWDQKRLCAKQFAYEGFFLLQVEIAVWVQYLETHRCSSLEEQLLTHVSEHGMA
jgi:hypothetical protein